MLDAHETAFPGELIADGDRRAVRVDAGSVPEALWAMAGAEHVAGVRDVLRRADGHDAVLPWCTERVELFLGRRAAAEASLSTGEAVTLAGSLLRGIVEAGERPLAGQWWLTDEGRPVFAPGEGIGCGESAAALLSRLRESCEDRAMDRLLGEIVAATGDRRVVQRSIERWERELTELAAPRALETEIHAPAPVSAIAVHRSHLPGDVEAPDDEPAVLRRVGERAVQLARRLRRWAAQRMPHRERAAVDTATRDSGRPPHAGRGRMLLVGGAAAAVVLLGGLMWPSAGDDSAATESAQRKALTTTGADARAEARSGDAPSTEAPSTDGPATDAAGEQGGELTPKPAEEIGPLSDGSVEQQAVELLAVVATCARAGDAVCAEAVAEGAGPLVHERLAGTDETRMVAAVEGYGDVSVLRLGPSGERGEQMLVLVAHNDGWLIRDVYDVADQPPDRG